MNEYRTQLSESSRFWLGFWSIVATVVVLVAIMIVLPVITASDDQRALSTCLGMNPSEATRATCVTAIFTEESV